ncbi:MAG: TonB-dependent receptor, partial [Gammaproteobacteria bacterium]|nr:TonB-dependent receptor [Gammaproteobacteria bacterium]
RVTRTQNDDTESAVSFDAIREIDGDFISGVETGVRYRAREKNVVRNEFDGSLGADLRLSQVPENTYAYGADNFLNGDSMNSFDYSELVFADVDSTLAYAASQGTDITPEFDPLGSYNIEEDTFAAYVQLNLDGEVGNVPFIGDFGFRVVYTQQDIAGFTRPFTIDGTQTPGKLIFTSEVNEPISSDDSYVNVLPSLNLRFELEEDLFLRVAASKSLTRPTFQALSPALSINPSATIDQNGDGIAATAASGNGNLKPYESTNFDLGMEWYFDEASALYASIYYKEIEDFIATVTNKDVTIGSVLFDSVSQPDNQGIAQLIGLEIGYQQAFESGFGYLVNASFTDNNADFESGGEIPFPGVSDISYNLAGYYEKGPLQARLAYSYRGDYLLLPSDVFTNQVFVEDYAQLDASVSFDVTESTTVFCQAVNLTDENTKAYTSNESVNLSRQFLSEGYVGRTFTLGVRASF